MKYFNELGLIPALERVLIEREFNEATDIQQQTIPILLEQKTDFIGLAQTGTGKTAAFGLPLLQKIDFGLKQTQGIILCPTREIAIQTFNELNTLSKYLRGMKIENVYGGTPVMQQAKRIQKNAPHIIVGTPGRVIDLLKRKSIDLSRVEYFILDEADEMLNMGFEAEIQKILEFASDDANTWLFSATMPPEIKNIVKKYMKNPVEVAIDKGDKVNKNIEHQYTLISKANKFDKLKFIIDHATDLYGVIFCRMKAETEELATMLNKDGYSAEAINGDLTQAKRESVIKRFKNKQTNILVASDVAARGLDIKNLTHVIHYALPDTFEYYTHRSGRTGRAGEDGLSIAFISKSEMGKLKRFEKTLNIKFSEYYIDLRPPSLEMQIEKWKENNPPSKFHSDDEALKIFGDSITEWSREDLLKIILHRDFKFDKKGIEKEAKKHKEFKFESNDDRGRGRDFEKQGNDKKKKSKKHPEKGSRSNNPDFTEIFINVGFSDGFQSRSLSNFIQESAGIAKGKMGNIEVFKRYSIFELDNSLAKHVSVLFKDVDIKGRKIVAKVDKEAAFS